MSSGRDKDHAAEYPDANPEPRQEESSVLQDMLKAVGLDYSRKKAEPTESEPAAAPAKKRIAISGTAYPSTPDDEPRATDAGGEEGNHGITPHLFSLKKIAICAAFLAVGAVAMEYVPLLMEPKPPQPDVAATYNSNSITTEQIRKFISQENIRDQDNLLCAKHGFDHSKCDKLEKCETHPLHSLESYQQILRMIAVQELVMEWANANEIVKRENISHSLKDMIEDTNVTALINELHSKQIMTESIQKWDVQRYFDENKDAFEDKTFADAENEIRDILLKQKDSEFFSSYIEELKQSAGLEVNLDVLKVAVPSIRQIEAYYRANPDKFARAAVADGMEMRIAPPAPGTDVSALVQEVVNKLQAGVRFEEVAARYAQGGAPIPVSIVKGTRGGVYEEQVWKLEPGEVSPAFEDGGTMVIFKMLDKTEEGQLPLAEVDGIIRQELLQANMDAEYALRKDEALFQVHGRRYTLGEFYVEFKELPAAFQAYYSSPDRKRFLVEQMIVKELLLEEYGDKPESKEDEHRVEHLKQEYLSRIFHSEKVDAQLEDVSDEEGRSFYEANKSILIEPATVKLSIISTGSGKGEGDYSKNRSMAEEALAALRNGANFSDIAKQYSQDATARYGGAIPAWINEEGLPPEIVSGVFGAKKGDVTQILETHGRFYIFKIDDRKEQRQPSYEELESIIKTHLKTAKHAEREADMEEELLKKAQFTVYNRTLRNLIKANEGVEIQ
jgi:parvulin-like peptidyl-prolyl isomerase